MKSFENSTSINEKEKEKDAANQNFIENIKGNENTEKKVQSMHEKEENRKARTTKKVTILDDNKIKLLNDWQLLKKVGSDCKVYVKHFSDSTTDYMKAMSNLL